MKFQKENWIKSAVNNITRIEKREIKFLIIKEFSKILLFYVFFMLLHPLVGKILRYWYGGYEEYLKHDILRLFTSSYYISNSLSYGHPFDMYYKFITEDLGLNIYLWIVPYSMAIIYCYIAYLIAHKIVDRTGIGATKKLSFLYFFFIFGISSFLARILVYDVLENIVPLTIIGYIIYKILKISVQIIKEKVQRKG